MSDDPDMTVTGDNDAWMLFERHSSDGYPLVVLRRTGNSRVDATLREGIVTIVHCEAVSALVNERGMPQHTDRIYPIEDLLAKKLATVAAACFHVASITGDGERRLVYAHRTPIDFASLLASLKAEGYSFRCSVAADRALLLELVEPTTLDRQLNGDRQVIANLQKHGDDGVVPRKIDFWFYGAKNGLDALISDLSQSGYFVDHWLNDPDGVVLTREMPADGEAFYEATPILINAATRRGVEYDGWETFVVKAASLLEPSSNSKLQSLLNKLFGAKKS